MRASPISPHEKEILLGLIMEEEVLQDNKTDGKSVFLKRKAWAKVTQAFNANNLGPVRTEVQLKKVWDRLKVK